MQLVFWLFCAALVLTAFEIRNSRDDLGRRALFIAVSGGLFYLVSPAIAFALLQLLFGPVGGWGLAAIIFVGFVGLVQIVLSDLMAIASISLARKVRKAAAKGSVSAAWASILIGWVVICFPILAWIGEFLFRPFH